MGGSRKERNSIFCINPNGWATIIIFNGSQWLSDAWSNGGNGWIDDWHISENDHYITHYTTSHDILAINGYSHWAMNIKWSGYFWDVVWSNNGNNTLPNWIINNDDIYLSGNLKTLMKLKKYYA